MKTTKSKLKKKAKKAYDYGISGVLSMSGVPMRPHKGGGLELIRPKTKDSGLELLKQAMQTASSQRREDRLRRKLKRTTKK